MAAAPAQAAQPAAAPAAAEAALALRETGLLSDPALVERAGRALRQRPADQLTPAAGALLLLIAVAAVSGVLFAMSSGQPQVALIIGLISAAFFSRIRC